MLHINKNAIKSHKNKSHNTWTKLFETLVQKTLELNAQFDKNHCQMVVINTDDPTRIYVMLRLPTNTFTVSTLSYHYNLTPEQQFLLNNSSKIYATRSDSDLVFKPNTNLNFEELLDSLQSQLQVNKRKYKNQITYMINF